AGIVKYVYTAEPDVIRLSHSKNLAFRLSDGEIVCFLDADNFTGKGFASFIIQHFANNRKTFLSVDRSVQASDNFGRICVRREDFIRVRGYDESMVGYGWEDIDLINRLKQLGLAEAYISDTTFLKAITHSNFE